MGRELGFLPLGVCTFLTRCAFCSARKILDQILQLFVFRVAGGLFGMGSLFPVQWSQEPSH